MNFTILKTETGQITCSINLHDYLDSLKEGRYKGEIKRITPTRSLQQNRYYFGVVVPIIAEWMGEEDKEFVHEVLKSLFLIKKTIKNPLDKRRKIILQSTTTNLDTKEFTEFIEKIRSKFSTLNIPDPNSNDAILAYNHYNKI